MGPDLIINNGYTKNEIESAFDTDFGQSIHGIIVRKKENSRIIILFSKENGPYTDEIHDNIFYYDGEGKDRDQELIRNNKVLADSSKENIPIYGFRKKSNQDKWIYLGNLYVEEYKIVKQGLYNVLKFKLKLIDGSMKDFQSNENYIKSENNKPKFDIEAYKNFLEKCKKN